ncbi:WD repeat containing protein 36 [Cordyceps fumosorosea ARSEF 2679]|uniref:WD repeat containing protein 36 n=1 Tax=Cordyceps fumosorosea (strain ARSEF 2679) TaxID=1081104 RepID=A0A168ANE0_CORFA|nr:WD repeat containing protein 36 [Cordyceps fumosorosea ARSEF 2679]OAA68973.1 WD repeat containing protein 36 [Cordyceps fumosorosea ARSEF 2679]
MGPSNTDGPLAKRQRVAAPAPTSKARANVSRIFAPFRITTSVGRALQTYDLKRGLNLVFVTRPETPAVITATFAWKEKDFAAWGGGDISGPKGLWVFQRGKKVDELSLPADLDEPIQQILIFGTWLVACASTRIEIFKSATLEHYTTIHTMAAANGDNRITGGVTMMPTLLNKILVGRKDGWVEIWNVSTGKLIYTLLPRIPDAGSVTCLEPSPALSLLAIAYSSGALIVTNVLTDKPLLEIEAGNPEAPITSISFRTDGMGAGTDGRKEGVMATATTATGDVTFWDLNGGGRVMSVLRSAHNPPTSDGSTVRGGISRIEFLPGQPVILTSGLDNSLKSWIFDASPFSPVPRVLHSRSGHSGPVNCLTFLPSDFDGAEAGNKWLISGGRDRSLWGWSLRRDGQSAELSQGNIRKKAKKVGILATNATAHGMTTTIEDLKAPEITCIATSINRDGGIGALPGKQPIWQKGGAQKKPLDAEVSGMTGWESVVTAHKGDAYARTWFWGRRRAGRWALPTGDGSHVSTVAISPCGTFAVVGSEEGGLDMYNLQSGTHRQRYPSKLTPAQARQVKAQQLRQGDESVLSHKGSGKKFLPGTGKHTKAITGLVVDSMNKYVISSGMDGKIKFWDFLTGTLLDQLDWAPMTRPTRCRYHPGSNLLAFSCDDNSVRVVDIETKRTIREFWGPQDAINDICFSTDGRWVIAASKDCLVRIWDLPTSHLIDAIRLTKPCNAIAMSATGEYLAASIDDEQGVALWTNKALFKHVPTRQISEKDLAVLRGPTVSGETSEGMLEGAFEDEEEDEDAGLVAPTVDQLSSEMTTLSLVPKSRWQTLLHLDLIKERNKPKEAPKAPEKAPFFLPSAGSKQALADKAQQDGADDGGRSRITKLEQARLEEVFSSKLRVGAESGNYDEFIDHLKGLSPSSADLELRSLSIGRGSDETNELLHFIRALIYRLKARRDYELNQAWMTVFLRLHFDLVLGNATLLAALQEWKTLQEREGSRLNELVGYCGGVGKNRRGGGSGRGGGHGGGNTWRDYPPLKKENEHLENFYNTLLQLPEEEKQQFWDALKRELPNSFRFCGSKGHALAVKRLLRTRYIPEITNIEHQDGRPVEPPMPVPWYPDELAWWMTTPKNVVRKFPPFAAFQKFLVSETSVGNISRQEVVSMIPPMLMDLKPGMTVLDMCAAPGSKSAQLLEMIHVGEESRVRKVLRQFAQEDGLVLGDETKEEIEADLEADPSDQGRATGLLIANDADYKRGHMLVHQLKRLSSPNLLVTNHDATQFPSIKLPPSPNTPDKPNYLKFDRILADVPCSGDGTLRKNANLWKDWQPGSALGLHATQIRILVRALQLLKVGGRVVYSTCSMNPVENESVIASAIERCGGPGSVEIIDCSDQLPGLKRVPGMKEWKIMDKGHRIWGSWEEVEQFAKESNEGVVPGRVSQTMFPKLEGSEAYGLPLERCMRVYSHLQDTGGFFITVLEKKTDFKAKNENERKPPVPASNGDDKTPAEGTEKPTEAEKPKEPAVTTAETATEDAKMEEANSTSGKRPLEEEPADAEAANKKLKTEADSSAAATPLPKPDPTHKQLKKQGPVEEPFKYLDPSHPTIQNIIDFYKLSPRFPTNRYMVRNEMGEPAKAIYYTTELTRDILTENEGRGIKIIHGGVRMFMKQDAPSAEVCRWRIQSEGMPILQGYVGETRIVRLRNKETLRRLLIEMFPKINEDAWRAFDEIGPRVRDVGMGCCVLRVEPEVGVDPDFSESMALPLWKSIHSLNLMLPKEDRAAMLLRIFNDTTPLVNIAQQLQQKSEAAKKEAAEREAAESKTEGADGAEEQEALDNADVEDLPSPE